VQPVGGVDWVGAVRREQPQGQRLLEVRETVHKLRLALEVGGGEHEVAVLEQEAGAEQPLPAGRGAGDRAGGAHDASSTVWPAVLTCQSTGSGGTASVRPLAVSSITGWPPTARTALAPVMMDITLRQGFCPRLALVFVHLDTVAAS